LDDIRKSIPRANLSIILSLALYFGWLLSFPFYGPVLSVAAPPLEYLGFSMPLIFIIFHTLTYLLAGFIFKNANLWKMLMFFSLGITIGTVTLLYFSPFSIWPWAMALLGVSAAVYIIGWTYPYTFYVSLGGRLKLMASVIIGANIVFIIFNLLSTRISPSMLFILSVIPLGLALLPLIYFPAHVGQKTPLSAPADKRPILSGPLPLIISLFVIGLYLCAGIKYNIVLPFINEASPLLINYRYLPYVAILLIIWHFGERLQRSFLIYMGISLLGLAFVSFALNYQDKAGMFLTSVLIEAAFACLDLYIWTTLGDLAFIYGTPFKFFGFVLAAMLSSILAGKLISTEFLKLAEYSRFFTALFAAAAIFLTYTVVPWLNELIQREMYQFFGSDKKSAQAAEHDEDTAMEKKTEQNPFDQAVKLLLPGQKLTPREIEVVALLLNGFTNGEIAAQLSISENTLKTHLRNIYPKFGVLQKKELLLLVFEKN
jgi:DNA-binding CsgD family transcriptional regulator